MSMSEGVVYENWRREAERRGWKTPVNKSSPQESWVRYWVAMDDYERKVAAGDPDPGRPVVPHRSA